MTGDETRAVIETLEGAYTNGRPWTEAQRAAYALVLVELEAGDAAEAVADWIRHEEWPPRPAQIRMATREVTATRELHERPRLEAPAPPPDRAEQLRRKGELQVANIRLWMSGQIDTAAMLRESGRIYAEEPPWPTNGREVQDDMETEIERLSGRPGPLAPQLRSAAETLTR